MNILYLNGMPATEKTPLGGIFVTKRVETLRKLGIQVVPVVLTVRYSKVVQKIFDLFKSSYIVKPLRQQENVIYKWVSVKLNLFTWLLCKLNPKKYENAVYKYLKNIPLDDIDLIHLHWSWPFGLGVKKLSELNGIPYIVTCHGSDINVVMSNDKYKDFFIEVLENSACVEFVSDALREKAISFGYSGKNAKVLYNGIDTDIFYYKKTDRNIKRIGFVGNLIEVKGADRLPEIFRKINQKFNQDNKEEVEFCVVGVGGFSDTLKTEMKDLPVSFLGSVSQKELSDIYRTLDILVMPSRSEGYPCVVKEAQACGVIVVGTDVGGVSEAIEENGIVVDDYEKIADSVLDILSGDVKFDINKVVEDAKKQSWTTQQNEMIQEYKRVINYEK